MQIHQSSALNDPLAKKPNPYQAPVPTEPQWTWGQWLRTIRPRSGLTRHWSWEDASLLEFIRGEPIMFEGVLFFLDRDVASTVHAAIALHENEPDLIRRCSDEVQRLLPGFLESFPDLKSTIEGRQLVIRFLSLYTDLDSEVAQRVDAGHV